MAQFLKYFLLITIFYGILPQPSAYKYLAVLPIAAKSHFFIGSALIKGLIQKGHEVTVISPLPFPKTKIARHIDVPALIPIIEEFKEKFFAEKKSFLKEFASIYDIGLLSTKLIFEEPGVKKLLKSNETFDAVLCEIFVDDALLGLAEHFKAPLIGYSTFGASEWTTDLVGLPSPPSFVPHPFSSFTDKMTFVERLANFAFYSMARIIMDFYFLPRQEAIYKEYFPHLNKTLMEIRRETSVVLLNNHVSLTSPRPYMPNMIEVGGLHIENTSKPLPPEMQKFLDEATDGAIYFSMGSNLQSSKLPVDKRNILLETFRGLKERVLWKFEDPKSLKNKPANVFVSEWFPQNDILAHPNVKLFITHGGLLSTMESIYHGKPVIGIPMFGDQFLNMEKAAAMGYGLVVDYKTISIPSFTAPIERILTEESFQQRAKEMSAQFRDQETNPLDRAVYWMELVARQRGAKYLHNGGQDLNAIQYFNIDVISVVLTGISFVLLFAFILIRIVWACLQNICGSHSASNVDAKKKRK